jgi:hypothetical protein
VSYLNDEGRIAMLMPPLGAIAVKDARVRKQADIPAIFA